MKKLLAIILSVTMLCMIAVPAFAAEGEAAEGTSTVAVGAIVIAADTVSEDAVYNFVSAIYENIDAITEQHAKGGDAQVYNAFSFPIYNRKHTWKEQK